MMFEDIWAVIIYSKTPCVIFSSTSSNPRQPSLTCITILLCVFIRIPSSFCIFCGWYNMVFMLEFHIHVVMCFFCIHAKQCSFVKVVDAIITQYFMYIWKCLRNLLKFHSDLDFIKVQLYIHVYQLFSNYESHLLSDLRPLMLWIKTPLTTYRYV